MKHRVPKQQKRGISQSPTFCLITLAYFERRLSSFKINIPELFVFMIYSPEQNKNYDKLSEYVNEYKEQGKDRHFQNFDLNLIY